jgi:hypothetical protein
MAAPDLSTEPAPTTRLALLRGPGIRLAPFTREGLARRGILHGPPGASPEPAVLSERLDDGAVLVDLLTTWRGAPAWAEVLGRALERHDDARGVFVFPADARGRGRTAGEVVAEVSARGAWRPKPNLPRGAGLIVVWFTLLASLVALFGVATGPVLLGCVLRSRRPSRKGVAFILSFAAPLPFCCWLLLLGCTRLGALEGALAVGAVASAAVALVGLDWWATEWRWWRERLRS